MIVCGGIVKDGLSKAKVLLMRDLHLESKG